MAGDNQAIPRIVALAATDDDRAVDTEPAEHIDAPSASVFHQHHTGDLVLLNRTAIDLTHRRSVQDLHSHWTMHLARLMLR